MATETQAQLWRSRIFALALTTLSAASLAACGSTEKKSDTQAGPTPRPEFGARDIKFFSIAPSDVRVDSLTPQLDALAIAKFKDVADKFTGPKSKVPFGEVGQPAGWMAAKALDHWRVHLGVHAKYKIHYCADYGFMRKLAIQDRELRVPTGKTFSLNWPSRTHDDAHTFIAAERLPTGEDQWRIVHYSNKRFVDAYIFRFNPVTEVQRQIVVLADQSFWMVDMPVKYEEIKAAAPAAPGMALPPSGQWVRDEAKPVRIKANFRWMKSEFDLAIQGQRVLVDWREEKANGSGVDWSRVNLVGRWGTFTFRPESPVFIPREIAMIDSNKDRLAAVYDLDQKAYIRYETNSGLRALNLPKPEPRELTFSNWGRDLSLREAITVDEANSRTVEPKVMTAMEEAPDSKCPTPGRLTLPVAFFSETKEFRKTFGLPEPAEPKAYNSAPISETEMGNQPMLPSRLPKK